MNNFSIELKKILKDKQIDVIDSLEKDLYMGHNDLLIIKHKEHIYKIEITPLEMWYDPDFGDYKECKCGHTYYRHFDTYENMRSIGCKYCRCYKFE